MFSIRVTGPPYQRGREFQMVILKASKNKYHWPVSAVEAVGPERCMWIICCTREHVKPADAA